MAVPGTGNMDGALSRFRTDSLRGVWHSAILRDRSFAVAQWERNLRLQGLPIVASDAPLPPVAPMAWDATEAECEQALETRYRALRQSRRESDALMRREPTNDGRGAVAPVSGTVNGTETRYSRRWQSSGRAYLRTLRDESGRLLDWGCYRVMPDGSREPVAVERKRSRKAAPKAAPKRRAAGRGGNVADGHAGTIRMAEVD